MTLRSNSKSLQDKAVDTMLGDLVVGAYQDKLVVYQRVPSGHSQNSLNALKEIQRVRQTADMHPLNIIKAIKNINEPHFARRGGLYYPLKRDSQIEKLYGQIKRWSYKGRPTRKVRKLRALEQRMEQGFSVSSMLLKQQEGWRGINSYSLTKRRPCA